MRGNKVTIIAGGTMMRGEVFSQDLLMIEGGVEGNVFGNKVVLKSTGWVHGDVRCNSLSIEPGGVVDGAVKVSNDPDGQLTEGIAASANELPEATQHTLTGEAVEDPADPGTAETDAPPAQAEERPES